MPSLRHIDALLGTCWQWDDDDDDAPGVGAMRQDLDARLDEWVREIEA